MKRYFGRAAAILPGVLLPFTTCVAAGAERVVPSLPPRWAYQFCLDRELGKIVNYNPEDPRLFALTDLTDEDVFPHMKSACAETRAGLLASANDRQMLGPSLDEVDANKQTETLDMLQRARPYIEEKVRMIRAPGPRPAVPLPALGSVTTVDYATMALENNDQGTSRATYTVGVDGRVSECSAEGATEALNAATCRFITRRWRYAPAIDANGNPVSEVRTEAMTYSVQ